MSDKAGEPRAAKVQPDDVPVGLMFTLLGALTAIVLVVLIVVWQFFGAKSDENLRRTLAKADRVLQRVNAEQVQLLNSYGVVDAKRGIYRMPVERAMSMLVANSKLLAPAPAPTSVVTPTGAGGSPQNGQPAPQPGSAGQAASQPGVAAGSQSAPKASPLAAPSKDAAPRVAPAATVAGVATKAPGPVLKAAAASAPKKAVEALGKKAAPLPAPAAGAH